MAVDEWVIGRWRPGWRDTGFILVWSAVYVGVVFALDLVMGWNYGFAGPPQPGAARTAADLFGPWPMRVVWMSAAVAVWFVLLGRLFQGVKRRDTIGAPAYSTKKRKCS